MSEEKVPYDTDSHMIREESLRTHFSTIPNLVDDMGLSPIAYRLYGHLKRVAGDLGACWQSTTTLATACNVSTGAISGAKKELQSTNPPLIIITTENKGGKNYHNIKITDIWKQNSEHAIKKTVHTVNNAKDRSYSELDRSPHETKKIYVKKNPTPSVLSAKELEQANTKVDHILEVELKAKDSYVGRDKFPPAIRDLIDAFVDTTGIKPTKKEQYGWLMAGQDWLDFGAQAKDVVGAIAYAKGKFAIMTPYSLTNTLRAYKAGGLEQQAPTLITHHAPAPTNPIPAPANLWKPKDE